MALTNKNFVEAYENYIGCLSANLHALASHIRQGKLSFPVVGSRKHVADLLEAAANLTRLAFEAKSNLFE